jgi:hypothetical protein
MSRDSIAIPITDIQLIGDGFTMVFADGRQEHAKYICMQCIYPKIKLRKITGRGSLLEGLERKKYVPPPFPKCPD